jgi:hypothetical protein
MAAKQAGSRGTDMHRRHDAHPVHGPHGGHELRPDPEGECPYCHRALERKTLRVPTGSAVIGGRQESRVVLEYWGCTNEACALMFWRRPGRSKSHRTKLMHH